jgi:Electron transfer DM13
LKEGTFTGNMSYTVSGKVKLYEDKGKKYLYFENYTSSNGPDLRVYISTNTQASQFVSLGKLKGVSGAQVYLITNPPDFTQYNKVLIWCQQFSVLFGAAMLQ